MPSLTAGDQIEAILQQSEGPVQLQDIYKALKGLGSTMSIETLMSLLSKDKGKRFKRVQRGVWTLPSKV